MSCRDWLYGVAIRGGLIAAAIFVWSNDSYAIGQPNYAAQYYQSKYQQLASVRPPLEGIAKFGGPLDYNSPCQETEAGPYSDLCQQWRMAKAAENQADWSRWQVLLSLLGIGGLIATIIYTHKTFRLTAKTSERELRAYVSLDGGSITLQWDLINGFSVSSHAELKNFGQTPAYDLRLWSKVRVLDAKSPTFDVLEGFGGAIVGPGSIASTQDVTLITPAENQDRIDGRKAFFVWGRVDYRDAFDRDRYYCFWRIAGVLVAGGAVQSWSLATVEHYPDQGN